MKKMTNFYEKTLG